jgi:hypothetical protein
VFGNALGDLAQSLQPRQWGELRNSAGLTRAFLETSGWNTGSHSVLQYANKGGWDPSTRQFLFVGSPHDNPHKFIIYSADSNSWRLGELPLTCMNEGAITGCGFTSHGYDHNCMDTVDGDLYLRVRGRMIYRYRTSVNRWIGFPEVPDTVISYPGVASSLEYFPEMGGVVYINGADGNVGFGNSTTYRWRRLASGLNMGPYHNLSAYSPVHKMVLFGGGNGSARMYKLTADGQISAAQDAPSQLKIQADNTGCDFTVDPVSGNFLAFYIWTSPGVYEYNPSANQWSFIAAFPGPVSFSVQGVVAAPVSTYGVIMFLTYGDPPRVFVYKHSQMSAVEKAPGAQDAQTLMVSPNPCFGSATLAFANPRRNADVTVFDARGRVMMQKKGCTGRQMAWDARGLPAGLYCVRVIANGKQLTKRILVLD